MQKFFLFTDPISAWNSGNEPCLRSAMQEKGFDLPTSDNPLVIVPTGDNASSLCIVYECPPKDTYCKDAMAQVSKAILEYIDQGDRCFVLVHNGSAVDPGRHRAQAAIFRESHHHWGAYHHANSAPYSFFCSAVKGSAELDRLRASIINYAAIAERIKRKSSGNPFPLKLEVETDKDWSALSIVYGNDLATAARAPSYGDLCEILNNVVSEIQNRVSS